ncbi:hypothetical protein A9X61_04560 [Enterobacter asburiae]|nr:hypothetical protein A9X61_04560 [Enterobacter asburiae]
MTKINISVSQTGQNAVLHTMLAGTFLSRAGYFMTWPYLSVVLYRQFGLSASLIGVIFICGMNKLPGFQIYHHISPLMSTLSWKNRDIH